MSERLNPNLHYPFDSVPSKGEFLNVAPGVEWFRIPIPFELNHINLWLLEDKDGYTLVDTGINSSHSREIWKELLESHFAEKKLKRIVITHFHPDHFGLARWLQKKTGAGVYCSAETVERVEFLLERAESEGVDGRLKFYRDHHIDGELIFEEFLKGNLYRDIISGKPDSISILKDGEKIIVGEYEWSVIMAYGHAPGHITLHCEDLALLISGDQILPTITSNVSVHADLPEEDPLKAYLESLDCFKEISGDTLVLPSHGGVFKGIHTRIEELRVHHDVMLERVLKLCAVNQSITSLLPKIFRRKMEGINQVLAFGEALAHINYLCAMEQVSMVEDSEPLSYLQVEH